METAVGLIKNMLIVVVAEDWCISWHAVSPLHQSKFSLLFSRSVDNLTVLRPMDCTCGVSVMDSQRQNTRVEFIYPPQDPIRMNLHLYCVAGRFLPLGLEYPYSLHWLNQITTYINNSMEKAAVLVGTEEGNRPTYPLCHTMEGLPLHSSICCPASSSLDLHPHSFLPTSSSSLSSPPSSPLLSCFSLLSHPGKQALKLDQLVHC